MITFPRRAFLTSMLAAGALALTRRAHADPLDDALARIAAARASLHTLVGPFTQERTISLLATSVKSQGTVYLVRPDRLRWELEPPDDVVYWITPEGLAYRSKTGQGRVPPRKRASPNRSTTCARSSGGTSPSFERATTYTSFPPRSREGRASKPPRATPPCRSS